MNHSRKIGIHLNICDTAPAMTFNKNTYQSGFRGEIELAFSFLENDILEIEVPGKENKAKVGGASDISDISIRICENETSIIPIYKTPKNNIYGCCACGSCGVCVYGSSACDPGCGAPK